MKLKLTIIALLMASAQLLAAEDFYTQLYETGNTHYKAGNYDSAITAYNQIISTGLVSSEVLYNLGNAYYKKNQLGQCILNYEKALKLSPGDPDIEFNLQMANQGITDKVDLLPEFFVTKAIRQVMLSKSADAWGVLAVLAAWICIISLLFYILSTNVVLQKIGFYAALFAFAIGLTTHLMGIYQRKIITTNTNAIVMEPAVTIKSEPSANGTKLFIVHEGIRLNIIEESAEWLKVSLTDGNVGWIQEESIERF